MELRLLISLFFMDCLLSSFIVRDINTLVVTKRTTKGMRLMKLSISLIGVNYSLHVLQSIGIHQDVNK